MSIPTNHTGKQKRAAIIILLIAALCVILCFCPWPEKIDQTLRGTLSSDPSSGEGASVSVTFDGYLLRYLFRQPAFKGELTIQAEDSGDILLTRRIIGHGTAKADEMTGLLLPLGDGYLSQSSVYDPVQNAYCPFEYRVTKDFGQFLMPPNEIIKGTIAAASDPTIDLRKVQEDLGD